MNRRHSSWLITPIGCLKFVAGVTILYLGVLITTPFPHYFPADFSRGFLINKESFFYRSGYFLGFYAHITCSPMALLCGTLQMSRSLRVRRPHWHIGIGKIYVGLVLCFVAPGGLIMSTRAFGGWSSTICFALISLLSWGFTFAGWQKAKEGRFAEHQRWMIRSYLMLCSAIMLRLVHYGFQPLGLDPTLRYQLAAWASWIPALLVYEAVVWRFSDRLRRPATRSDSDEVPA